MICKVHNYRIVDSFYPHEILAYVEGDHAEKAGAQLQLFDHAGQPIIREKILILACPNGHKMQMRESMLPTQRTPLVLP